MRAPPVHFATWVAIVRLARPVAIVHRATPVAIAPIALISLAVIGRPRSAIAKGEWRMNQGNVRGSHGAPLVASQRQRVT